MKQNIGNKGSSLVSVIALMVFLAAMSMGFLYMASFQVRTLEESREKMECIAAAKRFQRNLCVRIGTGMEEGEEWQGARAIEKEAQKVYEEAQQAYEEALEEWRRTGGPEEEKPLWEEYEDSLKNQVYRITGKTRKEGGGPEIQTELKIWYFSGRALAETRFFWKGEEIQLAAEIYMEEPYGENSGKKAGDDAKWRVRYYEEGRE